MKLENGDELIGMDILPGVIVAQIAQSTEPESDAESEDLNEEVLTENTQGPWVLVITTGGYGKRVPVSQFKLYNRATKGKIAIKFKAHSSQDQLADLRVVNDGDELMMVTSRGIIIRQAVNAISTQSRTATGVRVQRLDEDDAIAAVALVPPSGEEEEELEEPS
jgi:DNA gyrase subunit A